MSTFDFVADFVADGGAGRSHHNIIFWWPKTINIEKPTPYIWAGGPNSISKHHAFYCFFEVSLGFG